MELKFWGIRGTIPVPGKSTLKYGGNTPCIQLTTKEGKIIIIDSGTGIRELGKYIVKNYKGIDFSILISHSHWDHIQGIPFFQPFFVPGYNIQFYSPHYDGVSLDYLIDAQLATYFFPVKKKDVFKSVVDYFELVSLKDYKVQGIDMQTYQVVHPETTISFKFTEEGKKIVYMTDNELKWDLKEEDFDENKFYEDNKQIIEFCKDCDYLIHDTTYTSSEYPHRLGWGHSCVFSVAKLAIAAKVKNIVLFHYDPEYDDNDVDNIVKDTKRIIKESGLSINCIGSYEGLTLEV